MSSTYPQNYVEDKETIQRRQEVDHRTRDEKLITTVQICLRCGRKFPFKGGRKSCPHCQALLRTKSVIILSVP